MFKRRITFWITALLISTSSQAFASASVASPWRLFGDLSIGYGTVRGSEFAKSPDGAPIGIGFGVSRASGSWILDAGVGWMYSKLTGANAQGVPLDMRTRSGILELSARKILFHQIEAGPVARLLYGSDSGFGPSVDRTTAAGLAGIKIARSLWLSPDFPTRIFAQGLTDFTLSQRQVWMTSVGIQIGIPLSKPGEEEHALDSIHVSSSATMHSKPMQIVLDPQKIFFRTDSSKIKPQVKDILRRAGEYLAQNGQSWSGAEILGHADRRGSFSYNLRLSRDRAQSVATELTTGGVSPSKIEIRAFSSSRPLDPHDDPKAWAKNRRVELSFAELSNPEPLVQILKPLTRTELIP